MSYDDTFRARRTPDAIRNEPDPHTEPVTPSPIPSTATQPSAGQAATSDGADTRTLLNFTGFATRHPLLVERPSRYVQRLTAAAQHLFTAPDGHPEQRILFSPALALPFFLPHGDELFSDETIQYPLLHTPAHHPYDPEQCSIDQYALTLIAMYTAMGVILEPGDGDLYAYGVTTENYIIDDPQTEDDVWETCAQWAESMMHPVADVNIARLIRFTADDPDERRYLQALFESWDVHDPLDELLARGEQSAKILAITYNAFTDMPFSATDES